MRLRFLGGFTVGPVGCTRGAGLRRRATPRGSAPLAQDRPRLGTWRHCLSIYVDVPPDAMWKVVSDLGAISRFVPALVSSDLVADVRPSEGAVRACSDVSGRQWEEVYTSFEPHAHRLSLRFRTEADKFPYPMRCCRLHHTSNSGNYEGGSSSNVSRRWKRCRNVSRNSPSLSPKCR